MPTVPVAVTTGENVPALKYNQGVTAIVELQAATIATAFVDLALTAPWVNYGAPYENLSYSYTPTDVRLQGVIHKAATAVGAGTVIATLPVGARPSAFKAFNMPRVDAENGGTLRVDILTNGQIKILSGILAGTLVYLSFDNVSFRK